MNEYTQFMDWRTPRSELASRSPEQKRHSLEPLLVISGRAGKQKGTFK
jgi:hypothetical protein